MRRFVSLLGVVLAFFAHAAPAEAKRPIQVSDLFAFKRLADPQVSPDGKQVAFVYREVNFDENYQYSNLYTVPIGGGPLHPLTNNQQGNRRPKWSPDGKYILFESNRDNHGWQLYAQPVAGGRPRQLTGISTGASGAIWSPCGKYIAFVSSVWPEFSHLPFAEANRRNREKAEAQEKNPVKARVFTKLFYRHWDEYVNDKRQHLFVISLTEGPNGLDASEPVNVTPTFKDAFPTSGTFSAGDDFTFSPDSKFLLLTAPPDTKEAWSTDYEIWRVPVDPHQTEGRDKRPACLTTGNLAADGCPVFSPDGKWLAYRAQRRAGFEADKWEIMVVEWDPEKNWPIGKPRSLTGSADISAHDFLWTSDSKHVVFTAEYQAGSPIWSAAVDKNEVKMLIKSGTNMALSMSKDGKSLVFGRATMNHPMEIFVAQRFHVPEKEHTFEVNNISHANTRLLGELDMPRPESVTVKGAGGDPMQMWILKPPGFDPAKKWPLVYLVHGGPQGAWEDAWSYRWNAQVWAAWGYVVALPNPRGSTGFGQKYCDEISGDWGGKCYEDLMGGMDWLESQPYIDTDRLAAAGASFGGYMMNWFQAKTGKRFKTLITHCGVYNLESMWGTTDELWFDEWEHGGGEPPWVVREGYEKHSPHRFAKDFQTPMLIIHNDLDFRVPVSEGLQLFTTLQRKGIPSRFVNFPDEGHWVNKPKNSAYWHKEVREWLAKYAPPGGK